MEITAVILSAVALVTALGKLLLMVIDWRIEREVHQRVKMAAFTDLLTRFNELKEAVDRSGVLTAPKRRR